MNDAEKLNRYIKKKRPACIRRLVRQYKIDPALAEECVQQAFSEIHPKHHPEAYLGKWLWYRSRWALLSHWRKNKRYSYMSPDFMSTGWTEILPTVEQESLFDKKQKKKIIQKELQTLSSVNQKILLAHAKGKGVTDIAHDIGLCTHTVSNRLNSIKEHFARRRGEYTPSPKEHIWYNIDERTPRHNQDVCMMRINRELTYGFFYDRNGCQVFYNSDGIKLPFNTITSWRPA